MIRLLCGTFLFALCACGAGASETACEEYKSNFEALSCTETLVIDCLQYRQAPCTQPEYFSCLSDRYSCEDGELVSEGLDVCLAFRECPQ